jgi:hypothetical protein
MSLIKWKIESGWPRQNENKAKKEGGNELWLIQLKTKFREAKQTSKETNKEKETRKEENGGEASTPSAW